MDIKSSSIEVSQFTPKVLVRLTHIKYGLNIKYIYIYLPNNKSYIIIRYNMTMNKITQIAKYQ